MRWVVLVAVVVLVFATAGVPTIVIVLTRQQTVEAQNQINCTTLEAGLREAQAIEQNRLLLIRIAHSLGLMVRVPPPLDLPEVPEDCLAT